LCERLAVVTTVLVCWCL